jgi:hypothetical protein
MRKWLILMSALSATSASSAPAWTWVDANGQVHFSDRPVPGARQVEIAGAQGFGAAPSSATPAVQRAAEAASPTAATPAAPYRAVEIVSPADQETLRNIGGALPVVVRFQPNLQPGHRFDLALDGQRRNLNATSARVTLPDVVRGSHTLELIVVDPAGTEIMRSAPRTFFVQQTSILNPNNPVNRPAPR